MYDVFLTGGKLDGQKQKTFDSFPDALDYANELEKEYKNEPDPVCGGVAILEVDENGNKNVFEW